MGQQRMISKTWKKLRVKVIKVHMPILYLRNGVLISTNGVLIPFSPNVLDTMSVKIYFF